MFAFALIAFLAAGLFGLLGVRSGTVSDTAGGYELTLTYASVTRPGLSSPGMSNSPGEGGFDGPITIATTVSYLQRCRINGILPEPARATTTGDVLIWEFVRPLATRCRCPWTPVSTPAPRPAPRPPRPAG